MRKFVITTLSESGDRYMYFIEHNKIPTDKQIEKFLKKNANDIDDDGECYEYMEDMEEITEFQKLS